jgi:putative nucleotidyltransferase with HDIG domain
VAATPVTEAPLEIRTAMFAVEGGSHSLTSVATGLAAALKLRARDLHATTPMVRKLAVQVSRQMGLDDHQQELVDVCAQLRDVGMIGLPDSVLMKTGPLSPGDWQLLNRHPVLGAELLHSMPDMAEVAGVVRAHHERWDGEGYPDGLQGEGIPLLSRLIAVCDAFVAMASDRPHRRGIGAEGALEFIRKERGAQFEPHAADCLVLVITGTPARSDSVPRSRRGIRLSDAVSPSDGGAVSVARPRRAGRAPEGVRDLRSAITEFDVVPAFGPACERVLAATAFGGSVGGGGELVTAIESDVGLTVAVLRRARAVGGRRSISNVSDAVGALSADQIQELVAPLPRAAFPWQTHFEALLHHHRIHAQAVARAAERLGQAISPTDSDDLIAAALVHDIGKLVLARARPDFAGVTDAHTSPEERVRQERHILGVDHASLGGLLLDRWGLPERLVGAVAGHHSAQRGNEAAAFVRLADTVARHAQGAVVDRNVMLRLAVTFGLPANMLRDVLFDLPHAGGSKRRRAEESPLSARETAVLRLLAEGKRYSEIAHELDLSISTIRSHLHNIYAKLRVPDRAQAVLRATESAWI